MINSLRGFSRSTLHATLGVLALCVSAAAQGAPANQVPASLTCGRLVAQLSAFDHSNADPARADAMNRAEGAIAKQQSDLDRAVAQAHKSGCAGEGFFSLFSALSAQCGPLNSQIQKMRGDLDRMISDLERLKSGGTDQDGQRRAILGQLAQNNCGPQYASAAPSSDSGANPESGGFFDALFGKGTILNPNGDGAPSGTYHTVCVRTCDGYYFPISYSTMPNRFADDERACQRLCPASEVTLYTFRNPDESMDQATSISGQAYTTLPNAYRYRKEVTAGCSCRRPGQSWGDALKNADDASTLESGDIVVTDQKAKALSQAPQQGKPPLKGSIGQPPADATAAATPASDAKRPVRTVGPPFLSSSQSLPQPSPH
jgi:hypothetical protein